jgi:Domain of unknown function (DUF1127)
MERARQRRHLARLSDRMLSDIGLSRADVEREFARPFRRAASCGDGTARWRVALARMPSINVIFLAF